MVKSSTMETLISLATDEVEKAAVALGHAIRAGAEAEQRLTLLLQYREDYVVRFQENRKTGLSAMDYQNYHNFIDKLDEAISGQQKIVQQAQERIDGAKAVWQECERKRASYETLQKRAEVRKMKKELKQEQKEADEFNSRKARMAKLKR
ncbi:flagellar export protein FliJ [Oxalobacter sp. OttesenSCG-928-P03]|nr:flagellar export protein FliJ [Oxalobacter sp. OttesenSCG-928-P03]